MANAFAHIELTTADLGSAKKFYKSLFAWKLSDMPMGANGGVYTMIAPGKGPGGGMQAQPMPEAPVTWLPYVEVDSVAKTLAKAAKGARRSSCPRWTSKKTASSASSSIRWARCSGFGRSR